MKRHFLTFLVPLIALACTSFGCASQNASGGTAQPSLCDKARSAYNYLQAADVTAENGVTTLQAQLSVLPANDPTRKTLEGPLAKSQTTLSQIQTYLTLAKIAVTALCPDAAPPVPVPNAPINVPVPVPVVPVPPTSPVTPGS